MKPLTDRQVDQKIKSHLSKLRKTGVIAVRPGYEIAGHQLTGRRAIVATVQSKKPLSALGTGEALPTTLGGLPVDVREGSAYYRLRVQDPLAAEVSEAYARPEEREPTWPLEREMPSGKPIANAGSEFQETLKKQRSLQPDAVAALKKLGADQQLPYEPTGCPALGLMSLTADVTLAASPDAGFGVLTSFLGKTKQSLVIGMYDFTSGTILKQFQTVLASPKKLQMVLDSPALNKTADQSDWTTVQTLDSALGNRAAIARALTQGDHFVTRWSFPYAYHIKVIVRDAQAVWISSGNLNNSNEPPPAYTKTKDRDWHVVFENIRGSGGNLCDTFTAYLDYDFTSANRYQAKNPEAIEKAIEEARQKRQREANPTGVEAYSSKKSPSTPTPNRAAVAAKTFEALSMTVHPLLTPDRLANGQGQYLTAVMDLLGSATKSIYIELQYIEASKDSTSPYGSLLQALDDKITAGLDVRLIVSADYAEKWGEKMLAGGVDLTASIHTLPSVHNKGFIVDNQKVIVSSQNFSPAGVHDNRDAGVLMDSPQIAQYFLPIFSADWSSSRPLTVKKSTPKAKSKVRAVPKKKRVARKAVRRRRS